MQSVAVTSYTKTFLSITGRSSGHVHTRNRHEIERATDRRQNLVPEKSSTRSVCAPTFGAEIWTVCHQLTEIVVAM